MLGSDLANILGYGRRALFLKHALPASPIPRGADCPSMTDEERRHSPPLFLRRLSHEVIRNFVWIRVL